MAVLMLVGASGLVGQSVLALARNDARVTRVIAPTRRPLPPEPKLQNPLVDFAALPASAPWWRADALVCTLGTTLRQAGSRDAFRQVDFDMVLACAKLARRNGAHTFALNSTLGADPNSRSFYLRVKGEVERASTGCGFSSLTFVRPSLIRGQRSQRRPLEALALYWMQALAPAIPRRWRPVTAASVAHALLEAALAAQPGVQAVESDALS